MRGRASVAIELSEEERSFLKAQLRKHKAERSLSDRCRIVLRCADGLTSKQVAAEFGHAEQTVGKWRRRFAKHRIEGCRTNTAQAAHARFLMPRLPRSSNKLWKRRCGVRPIGRSGRWQLRPDIHTPQSGEFGMPLACNRIGPRRSNCPPIHCS